MYPSGLTSSTDRTNNLLAALNCSASLLLYIIALIRVRLHLIVAAQRWPIEGFRDNQHHPDHSCDGAHGNSKRCSSQGHVLRHEADDGGSNPHTGVREQPVDANKLSSVVCWRQVCSQGHHHAAAASHRTSKGAHHDEHTSLAYVAYPHTLSHLDKPLPAPMTAQAMAMVYWLEHSPRPTNPMAMMAGDRTPVHLRPHLSMSCPENGNMTASKNDITCVTINSSC